MLEHCKARWRAVAAIALGVAITSSGWAQDLAITNVQPSSLHVDPERDREVRVRFHLSAPAEVALQVYDGREILVREVRSADLLSKGEHSLAWDLRDSHGRRVPAEAYVYALEASADGKSVRYDLADVTGAETLSARDVKWDANSKKLTYVLDKPARVAVRLGMTDGGPLLRTLLDWVARPAGLQHEDWDGQDESGVLDLSRHPKLAISVHAFALPDNAILIGGPQDSVKLIEDLSGEVKKRPAARTRAKRMYAHAQQPLESRADFKISLTLPTNLPEAASGVPIVSGAIPVRLDVDAADRGRAMARRFEPVFFVDGQFAFENEVGFVPMTWNFDPRSLNEGEHYLTVNLRGYEGNFGIATLKVLVQRNVSAANKEQ